VTSSSLKPAGPPLSLWKHCFLADLFVSQNEHFWWLGFDPSYEYTLSTTITMSPSNYSPKSPIEEGRSGIEEMKFSEGVLSSRTSIYLCIYSCLSVCDGNKETTRFSFVFLTTTFSSFLPSQMQQLWRSQHPPMCWKNRYPINSCGNIRRAIDHPNPSKSAPFLKKCGPKILCVPTLNIKCQLKS
jgi:hypothetical protein